MKKVLITGGSGFIGSFLAEHLGKKNYHVTVFDLEKPKFESVSTFIKGNILNKSSLMKTAKGKDIIFHLAGILGTHETIDYPQKTTSVNIIGTLNALDSALKNDCSFLYVSKPNVWLNPYTISKVAAEAYVKMYQKEFNLPTRIVVWFNVYGPRQRFKGYQKAIPTWILEALKNKPLTIFGNGKQTMDLIYVTDTVEATVKVAESKKCLGKKIDIGSRKERKINDVAKLIIKLTNSNSALNHLPMRRGETEHTRIKANINKLIKLTGYQPKTKLKDGLLKTIDYYRQFV